MHAHSTVRAGHRLTLVASVVATVTALAGCGSNDPSSTSGMDHGSSAPAPAAPATPAVSGTPASGPHNDADVMFAQMMIPHHQQAIEMSNMLLAKSDINPDVTTLAEKIKAAQSPEIAQMSGWLSGWGKPATPSMGMDHDMGDGMMTQVDMDALEQATGDETAKLFLTGMVKHYQGAIAMAEKEVADGQNVDAVALAEKIVADQKVEIATMNQLLQQQ